MTLPRTIVSVLVAATLAVAATLFIAGSSPTPAEAAKGRSLRCFGFYIAGSGAVGQVNVLNVSSKPVQISTQWFRNDGAALDDPAIATIQPGAVHETFMGYTTGVPIQRAQIKVRSKKGTVSVDAAVIKNAATSSETERQVTCEKV